jgi:hypothetical protein
MMSINLMFKFEPHVLDETTLQARRDVQDGCAALVATMQSIREEIAETVPLVTIFYDSLHEAVRPQFLSLRSATEKVHETRDQVRTRLSNLQNAGVTRLLRVSEALLRSLNNFLVRLEYPGDTRDPAEFLSLICDRPAEFDSLADSLDMLASSRQPDDSAEAGVEGDEVVGDEPEHVAGGT